MPNFNLNYGGSQKVESYLHQLNEQLRYILNNLDGENFSPVYLKTVEKTQSLAEMTSEAVNNLQEGVKVDYKKLNDRIIAQAEEINQTFETEIKENNDNIMTTVREEISAKASIADLNAALDSYVTQTSTDVEVKFSENYSYSVYLDGKLEEFIKLVETYFEFSTDGLRLKKIERDGSTVEDTEKAFEALLSTTELSFWVNKTRIGYLSGGKLYINNVEILNSLIMGNWVEELKGNKNRSLRWVD